MMKHWKQIAVIVVTMATYCVLMSVQSEIANPGLRTAASVVAGVSIGIALIVSLRLGRRIGGRTGRR